MHHRDQAQKSPHLRNMHQLMKGQLKFQHLHTAQKGGRLPRLRTHLPRRRPAAKQQDNRLAVPGETAVPEGEMAVPEGETAVPEREMAIPEGEMAQRQQGRHLELHLWSLLMYMLTPLTGRITTGPREMASIGNVLLRAGDKLDPQVTLSAGFAQFLRGL